MSKIILVYDPYFGEPVPDSKVGETLELILINLQRKDVEVGSVTAVFSTENIFNRLRLGMVRGELGDAELIFQYQNVDIPVNRYGEIANPPEGFLGLNDYLCVETMVEATKLRKKERRR